MLIDNINCTGNEQSLTDCMFSPEVSDCLGNIPGHKVGVSCHEESKIMILLIILLFDSESLRYTFITVNS